MADSESTAARRSGPTIYDVAAACGVAPSTVSRTFSRPGRVNAETASEIAHEELWIFGALRNGQRRQMPTTFSRAASRGLPHLLAAPFDQHRCGRPIECVQRLETVFDALR